jgi:hypothetical protein
LRKNGQKVLTSKLNILFVVIYLVVSLGMFLAGANLIRFAQQFAGVAFAAIQAAVNKFQKLNLFL